MLYHLLIVQCLLLLQFSIYNIFCHNVLFVMRQLLMSTVLGISVGCVYVPSSLSQSMWHFSFFKVSYMY